MVNQCNCTWPIVLNLFAADQLIEIERRCNPTEGERIGLGNAVYVISSDHRARAGHILNDKIRIARDVFGHVLSD